MLLNADPQNVVKKGEVTKVMEVCTSRRMAAMGNTRCLRIGLFVGGEADF